MSGEVPAVSVLMPVYNAAPFVARAVRSALAQEVAGGLEIVAVDDGSTDGTGAALAALAAEDGRLRVLSNDGNRGVAYTRNRAAAEARGGWLAVLDADDAYAPGRLARLVGVAEAEGVEVIADLLLYFDLAAGEAARSQLPADGSLERLTLRRLLESAADLAGGLDYGLLKPVFRRELVERGLWRYPEKVRHGEDFFAYLGLLGRGVPFGVLHEAHYIFSTRIGEQSGAYSPGSVTDVDYRAIIRDTEALMARIGEVPLVDLPEAEALALLARRIAKAAELNRRHGWNTLRKGAWARHRAWLAQDWRNAPLLAGMALGKLKARLTGRR